MLTMITIIGDVRILPYANISLTKFGGWRGLSTKVPGHHDHPTLTSILEKGLGSDQLDQTWGYLYQRPTTATTLEAVSLSLETLKETGFFHMSK